MDRIQGVTVAPGNQFTEGNPATATPATIVSAEWLNGVQEELISIIVAAGLTPDQATLTQVRDAIAASYAPKTSTANRLATVESEVGTLRTVHTYRLTDGGVALVDGTPSTFPFPSIGVGSYLVSANMTMVGGVPSATGTECGQTLKVLLRKAGASLKTIEHEWFYKNLNHYGGVSQSIILPPTILTAEGTVDVDIQVQGTYRYGFTSMQTSVLDLTIQGIS